MRKQFWPALILFAVTLSPAHAARTLCTMLVDAANGEVLTRKGDCDTRVTPASTFKLPIALMGFDSGFLKDEHTPRLPFREGYADWIASWRTDTDPTSWIENSVVWYSQQITKALGDEQFRRYVEAFDYGNRDVSGDPGKQNGLTNAWLSSSLKISPAEQAAFLVALTEKRLPVSSHAYEMLDIIAEVGPLDGGWTIRGKTGAGRPRKADGSPDPDNAYGWFVGWATRGDRTIVFVRLTQKDAKDRKRSGSPGRWARDAFMKELPALLPRP